MGAVSHASWLQFGEYGDAFWRRWPVLFTVWLSKPVSVPAYLGRESVGKYPYSGLGIGWAWQTPVTLIVGVFAFDCISMWAGTWTWDMEEQEWMQSLASWSHEVPSLTWYWGSLKKVSSATQLKMVASQLPSSLRSTPGLHPQRKANINISKSEAANIYTPSSEKPWSSHGSSSFAFSHWTCPLSFLDAYKTAGHSWTVPSCIVAPSHMRLFHT